MRILPIVNFSFLLLLSATAFGQPIQFRGGGVVNRADFTLTELSSTVYVDEVTGEVRSQVDRAKQFIDEEQWAEAIDMLARLSESIDTKVTGSLEKHRPGFERFVSVPEFVNQCLSLVAINDPVAYAKYRDRIRPLTEQWFAEAKADRDPTLLKKIAREHLHCDAADDALLLLGDASLEAGKTEAARRYWRQLYPQLQWQNTARRQPAWRRIERGEVVSAIVRDLEADPLKIASHHARYLQTDIPLADVWARLTLASILEGDMERAKLELEVLRKTWNDVEGNLGGQKVNYLKALSSLMNESRFWKKPKPNADWPTFAGSADRNVKTATVVDIPTKPNWRVDLKPAAPVDEPRGMKLPSERAGEDKYEPSSHFPIVVGEYVFIHDENRIRCLRLRDGKPAWGAEDGDGAFFTNARVGGSDIAFSTFEQRPTERLGEPRFTLSAAGSTLVATLGSHQSAGGSGNPALMGFDLTTEGGVQFGPVEIENGSWSFHGAPVCEATRCWVGLRQKGATSQDFVACFDTITGEELWRTKVCSADSLGHNTVAEVSNYLLTKQGDTIYCSSHLGTIAAIDADDGQIRWVTKYPRQGPKRSNLLDQPWHALRDLTPCLYHAGILIVAPSDTNKIFALHAGSGMRLWETEFGGDANQLLGVGENNHLILSGRRLWWIDVFTGSLSNKVDVNPFPSGGLAQPNGAGRGVLSGGNIYWPTRDDDGIGKIFVLSQSEGKSVRQPIDLEAGKVTPGNLVVTPTHLLIASSKELVAYRIDTQ